jgi:uncharacterized RDD family membrane protein YckC
MFCASCGATLADGVAFCPVCGARAPALHDERQTVVAAAYGRRVAAWIIDAAIAVLFPIVVAAILIVQSQPPGADTTQHGQTGIGFLILVFSPLYSALLHRYWHGQTIGKRLLRIRVVTRTGDAISLGMSLGRSYLRMALFVAFWVPWIIDSLWPLANSERRSLHDLAVGTMVIPAR